MVDNPGQGCVSEGELGLLIVAESPEVLDIAKCRRLTCT